MIQLASNSEDLLTYLPLNRGFDPTLLAADIDDALRDYILPYLSRAQFDVSFASVDAKHVELISIVKKSAFNLALGSWLRLGKVYISESGIQYGVEKDKQASSEDKADAIASAKQKGLKAIDQLLLFLEQNADIFTEWKQSSSYTVYTASFVRNANEFGIINNSRSVFLQLKTFIQDVERMYIEDLLPIATIATLLSRNFSLLTAENKAIYERLLHNYIIPFVRDMSMSKAARSMAVIKDQYGTLTVFENIGANHAKGYKTVQKDLLEGWIEDLTNTAQTNLGKMAEYIAANKEVLGITEEVKPEQVIYRNDLTHGTAYF